MFCYCCNVVKSKEHNPVIQCMKTTIVPALWTETHNRHSTSLFFLKIKPTLFAFLQREYFMKSFWAI